MRNISVSTELRHRIRALDQATYAQTKRIMDLLFIGIVGAAIAIFAMVDLSFKRLYTKYTTDLVSDRYSDPNRRAIGVLCYEKIFGYELGNFTSNLLPFPSWLSNSI